MRRDRTDAPLDGRAVQRHLHANDATFFSVPEDGWQALAFARHLQAKLITAPSRACSRMSSSGRRGLTAIDGANALIVIFVVA